jgi:hypothetical protein
MHQRTHRRLARYCCDPQRQKIKDGMRAMVVPGSGLVRLPKKKARRYLQGRWI